MSVREFAAHLGVSDRMVSKWEAGGSTIRPRPVNQAALDTSLARAAVDVRARFAATAADGQAARVVGARSLASSTVDTKHLVVHPIDGKVMTLVDAGQFIAGHNNQRRWLAGFYLDVHPVTQAEYTQFVAVTGHRAPAHWPDGTCPEPLLNHPVVMVSWQDAQAYAAWAAKALPTGQQWEKAARGASGLTFPWGNFATPAMCNVRASAVGTTTPCRLVRRRREPVRRLRHVRQRLGVVCQSVSSRPSGTQGWRVHQLTRSCRAGGVQRRTG